MIKDNFKQKKIKRKKKVTKLLVISVSAFVILTGGYLIFRRQTEKLNHYKSVENKIGKDNTKKQNKYSNDDLYNGKVAYLTFDDGPSKQITPQILDILDEYNIKATFFVVGQMALQNKDILEKEFNEGDEIGNHTYTHDYKYIYSNPKNLINDFNKGASAIKSILGDNFNIKYVRFPGGSFGKRLQPFRAAVQNAGLKYIDWNSLNGDAEGQNISVDKLIENVKETSKGKDKIVILMHDISTKQTTVQALPQIIKYLRSQGYSFKTL